MVKILMEQNRTSNFFYLLIGLLVLLSILFVMGGDEGLPFVLGRVIGFVIVVILAYRVIDWSHNITEIPDEWTQEEVLDEDINLRVQDISELLKRASEGKEKSQEILHERLKKIFFLKLKEIEDLSDQDLRELMRNLEEFRKVVQDEVIADFILSIEEKSSETNSRRPKFLSSSKGNRQKIYKKKIKEIIQKIDEWEERYHE